MRAAVLGLSALMLGVMLVIPGRVGVADDAPSEDRPGSGRPPTLEQVVGAVVEAFRANDRKRLHERAVQDTPDPWVVADELCRLGEADAAAAFAGAAPRKDTEHLAAYVDSRRNATPLAAAREALRTAQRAAQARRASAVLAATKAMPDAWREADPVVWVQLQHWRGLALKASGRLAEASDVYYRAAQVAETIGWLRAVGEMLRESGSIAARRRDFVTARERWRRHLVVARERGDRKGLALAFADLGNVHHMLGAHEDALESYRRAIEIGEAIGDRVRVAQVLTNVGWVHAALGERERALDCYRRSLAVSKAAGGAAGAAVTLCNISRIHRELGCYAEALRYLDLALDTAEAQGDRRAAGMVHNHMGLIAWRLGEFEKALESYRRSLEIRKALGDGRSVATVLTNMGLAYEGLEDYERALEHHRESREQGRTLGQAELVARATNNIGNIHIRLKEYEKALESHQQAYEVADVMGNGIAVAVTLGNIGAAHMHLGRLERAVAVQEKALELLERFPEPSVRVRLLYGLARTFLTQGAWDAALARSREAVAVVDRLGQGLSDEQSASAGDLWAEVFEIGIRAATRAEKTDELAYFLESGRAGALRVALGARESLRSVVIPESLQREESGARLAETRTMNALRAAAHKGGLREVRAARQAYDEARVRMQAVISRIQREARHGAAIAYPQADDLDGLQARLHPTDALVLYGLTPEESVALVIRPDSARTIELGRSAEINSAAATLDASDAKSSTTAAVANLRRRLVEPLQLDAAVRRVLVSPAGRLGYLPFALLMPDREVAYVPSGTTYGVLLDQRDMQGEKVLALGDPDYDTFSRESARDVTRGAPLTRLVPLKATREEVTLLGDTTLLGADATEANLQAALQRQPRWRAVHFACHGLVDPDRPLFSSLAIAADEANDGFLSCLDVFRLRIPADLVVLSACETGKGRIYKTEGIVGLTRAFMFAGAPRVICSLWKVDDEATKALMVKFYELWNPKDGSKGLGAAAALTRAQAHVREHPDHPEWKHPYYWAAWVLWGLPD